MERHDHDQKEWLDADLIGSYDALSRVIDDMIVYVFLMGISYQTVNLAGLSLIQMVN